jgi:carbon-monoxide dehydrogenase small subunit
MQTTINKKVYNIPDELKDIRLTDFLREHLNLTGVKNGCEMRACGACAILVNDKSMRICHTSVKDVENCEVLTIEGMENEDGTLHPLQQAFIDYGAIQCGFCTPGMVLTAHALLLSNNSPTREQIRKALQSNLCRCTGYQQIVDAIEAASVYYK